MEPDAPSERPSLRDYHSLACRLPASYKNWGCFFDADHNEVVVYVKAKDGNTMQLREHRDKYPSDVLIAQVILLLAS